MSATYRIIDPLATSSPGPRAIDTGADLCLATADDEEILDVDGGRVSTRAGVLVCDLPQYHDGPHWDEQDITTWGLDL